MAANILPGMGEELKQHMRARIDQCRRLAKFINDPRTTEALLQMAKDGETDLAKLEAAEANMPKMEAERSRPTGL